MATPLALSRGVSSWRKLEVINGPVLVIGRVAVEGVSKLRAKARKRPNKAFVVDEGQGVCPISDSTVRFPDSWVRGENSLIDSDLVYKLSLYVSAAKEDTVATVVNIHECKTHFSKLVRRAHEGEEILVAKAGTPYARIVPLDAAADRRPGLLSGRLGEAFFDPLPDQELERWEQ